MDPAPSPPSTRQPDLSVVLCTYDRAAQLEAALGCLLDQHLGPGQDYEVIVVDNNSSDGTPRVVQALARLHPRLRYSFEPWQGLSHARNHGAAIARAERVAFTDDDVRVGRDWVAAILRSLDEWPDASVVGGRVLPDWPVAPPRWLTERHWSPLALADHGEAPFRVDASRFICLVGANLAVRRESWKRVGGFHPALQRVRDGVGSIEDHEFLRRIVDAGGYGVYDPRIVVRTTVPPERMQRAYHRRWHLGHGRFHARWERMSAVPAGRRTLLGTPLYVLREIPAHVGGWVRAAIKRRPDERFAHEARLWFLGGVLSARPAPRPAVPEWSGTRPPAPGRASAWRRSA